MISTDIGVAESGGDRPGFSLQLTGTGASYEDFTWVERARRQFRRGQHRPGFHRRQRHRPGQHRRRQRASRAMPASSELVFTVRRAGGLNQSATVDYVHHLTGTADAADFAAGQPARRHSRLRARRGQRRDPGRASPATRTGEVNETFNCPAHRSRPATSRSPTAARHRHDRQRRSDRAAHLRDPGRGPPLGL